MIARFATAIVIVAAVTLAGCAPKFEPSADYQGGFLWDSDHSRSVTVGPDDTLYSVSRRYDVPTRVIVARNALQPPYALRPGQQLIIDPVRTHVVSSGDTLYRIAADYKVPQALIVEANEMQPPYTIYAGQKLWIPDPFMVAAAEPMGDSMASSSATGAALPEVTPARPSSAPIVASALPPPPGATALPGSPGAPRTLPADGQPPVVINQPQPDTFSLTNPAPPALPTSPPPPVVANPPQPMPLPRPPIVTNPPQPEAAASTQTAMIGAQAAIPPAASMEPGAMKFVWPVKGRLISGFGPAGQGLHNDGINIGAPAGTQVRAVASGTVVYAGSELKGFGNLLLIKHDNGLTTAYAHADKLLVTKGDVVKQNQVIATVGKSGNVDSPQLHFEVRRGTQAVDPQPYLQR